jgi:undecaprenyl-diphosphatase
MNLFEDLLLWDKQTLLNINNVHNPWMDRFMWLVSETMVWLPLALVFIFILFRNKGNKAFLVLLAIGLVFLLADQITASIIKPLVARPRPTRDPEIGAWVNLVNGYRGGMYGFVSSHAANVFSFAIFTTLLLRNGGYTVMILLWAALVSYSRMYLGVHYPLDVLGGAMVGGVIAYTVYYFYRTYFDVPTGNRSRSKRARSNHNMTDSNFAKGDVYVLILSMMFLLITLLIAAHLLAWS